MENPLVSVVVITYNSSKFILECLDSIYNQTYQDIELIISDDCSKDNTVEICSDWLAEKGARFVETQLISVEKNTGTSANLNRGIKASLGEWIKPIAGDDRLLPRCIDDNVAYVCSHSQIDYLFSEVIPFGENNMVSKSKYFTNIWKYFELLNEKEFKVLLCKKNFIPACAAFINKQCLVSLGGYEESIPLIEDWPLWVKSAINNKQFSYLPIKTVEYRFHHSSISQNPQVHSPLYMKSLQLAEKFNLKYMKEISFFYWFREYVYFNYRNSNNPFWKFVFFSRFVNPYTYYLRRLYDKISTF